VRMMRNLRCRAEASLANLPDEMFLFDVVEDSGRWRMWLRREGINELPHFAGGLLLRLSAEFDDQPCVAIRNQLAPRRRHALVVHVREHAPVDALEGGRRVLVAEVDAIAGREDVRKAEYGQGSNRRAMHESELRLEHRDARALGAHERARDVEAVFR